MAGSNDLKANIHICLYLSKQLTENRQVNGLDKNELAEIKNKLHTKTRLDWLGGKHNCGESIFALNTKQINLKF